jgi:hypothetical protein
MSRVRLLCLVVVSGLLVSTAAAAGEPVLRSVSSRKGHLVITFSIGRLSPGEFVVATSGRQDSAGALVSGIRLREKLTISTPRRSRLTWRSPRAIGQGAYFVQISGIDAGGAVDCTPRSLGCGQAWSNALRVVVKR